MTFAEFGLPMEIVEAVAKLRLEVPTAIQVAAIPPLLAGKDAYVHAPTGTGKTLAYLLPVFARIVPTEAATQVVIVAPTHELAIQIQRVCGELGLPIRSVLLVGGTSMERQLDKLKKHPHVAIGTLGRIADLVEMNKLKMRAVKTVVVDEADRMWVPENKASLQKLLEGRQRILVSATLPEAEIPGLEVIEAGEEPVNENIEHFYLVCEEREKPALLRRLLHALKPERAMVFVQQTGEVEPIAAQLEHHKVPAVALHAAGHKFDRKHAMDEFRSGRIPVMVASDVGARGLDIAGVTHVINMDAPGQSRAYLHRVGRSARGTSRGQAVTLVTAQELNLVRRYEAELGVLVQAMRLREGRMIPEEGEPHRERRR